jgi:thiol:disulfide interchange protein
MKRISRIVRVWAAGLLLILAGSSGAAPPNPDPFAPENQASAPKAVPDRAHADRPPPTADRIDFEVGIAPKEVKPGETFKLTITGTPRKGFHTYPITQRANDDAQPPAGLSKLKIEPTPGLQPLWPITESPPEWEIVPGVGALLVYQKRFTWSQDILVLPDATPGTKTLRFSVKLQVCDKSCVWGEHHFELPVVVTEGPGQRLSADLEARMKAAAPEIRVVSVPSPSGPMADQSFLGVLFAAMGAAIAMLFTPCVFPMIPITVSFFLKQAEKKHHNAPLTACVYSLTIVVVLALAVLLLGKLIVDWANSPWLNLGLGLVLVFFALSLFGMYEIELPSFLSQFTASREGQGGYLGAFFMALTFTITSFTCTGPFLGPLLVAAKEFQLSLPKLIVASFAYSATFAAPFFVLALFPRLLKALPKSGGWLNAVKVVMGFLELAAALKFLANTDLTLNPGNPWFFSYDTVLCAWIALSFTCGLYLFGLFRLPHDSPVEHVGVPRMVLATIFLGLGVYMMPALWREVPTGIIGRGLVAFLPLDTRHGKEELPWKLITKPEDYETAWVEARREGKLIFIDFTGVTCTNCRANEKQVFPMPAVREELQKFVLVQMYTDSVPSSDLSTGDADTQARRNSTWQTQTFGEASNPLYVVLKPDDGPAIDEQEDKLRGREVGRDAGLIREPQKFVAMLKKAQEQKGK